jgi:mevalonate kinase
MVGNKGRINYGSNAVLNHINHSPKVSGSGIGQNVIKLIPNDKESDSSSKSLYQDLKFMGIVMLV